MLTFRLPWIDLPWDEQGLSAYYFTCQEELFEIVSVLQKHIKLIRALVSLLERRSLTGGRYSKTKFSGQRPLLQPGVTGLSVFVSGARPFLPALL